MVLFLRAKIVSISANHPSLYINDKNRVLLQIFFIFLWLSLVNGFALAAGLVFYISFSKNTSGWPLKPESFCASLDCKVWVKARALSTS
jgi:hypothetical protein